ncbi:SagB-type dehydrogenase domain-containing protein [Sinosporangium album]|uniref:SagB-type dehydrogenase domain-containing protein n=1 Tax=Sinosporangium album TaxID=504805 RepID=A0A1G7SGM6_9ACTN|nr:SagB-type dehydrogenase domain-containing protein [Sinosporangium album]
MSGAEAAAELVAGLGFAVRDMPLPLYLNGWCLALLREEAAGERLDLTGAPVEVLDVAAGADRAAALWRLLAGAAALRLEARGVGGSVWETVGAGSCEAEATAAAVYDLLARVRAGSGGDEGRRIVGWESAVRHPWRSPRDIGGELACHLLEPVAGVPCVGAVLRLAGSPSEVRVLACDLSVTRAVDKAVYGVLRGHVLEAGRPTGADFAEFAEKDQVRLAELDDGSERTGGIGHLRDVLRRHAMPVSTQRLAEEAGAVLVRAKISAEPPPAEQLPGGPGLWDAPRPGHGGTVAPAQLSLPCERDRVEVSRAFHENSKLRAGYGTLPKVDLARAGAPVQGLLARAHRDFPHARRVYGLADLERPVLAPLEETVSRRRSWAPIGATPLGLPELAGVLRMAYGTTGSGRLGPTSTVPLRATPSAGGLYPIDLFVLVTRVDGVEPGLYYFHPSRMELQLVTTDYDLEDVLAHSGYAARVGQAAAIVLYVASFRRNQWKYWERGYRTVLLDCGHLAHSVVLTANASGLVAHPMVAFADDYFNRLVGVDGVDDAVLYLTLLGRAKERP